MERTTRCYADSRKSQCLRQSVHEGRSRLQRIPVPMHDESCLVENSTISWRMNRSGVVEQNVDVPMPQILKEIVEIEAIVDIPVLQFEFILL